MARRERDSLGELEVPDHAYYGIQTQRALDNFPVTGQRLHPEMIHALGLVKRACAEANRTVGLLPEAIAAPIITAATEVSEGRWDDQFPVDPIQGGAGTSINMNANEVIANRALELAGRPRGDYAYIHPLIHVNMSQSTNDVVPTAYRIALLRVLEGTIARLQELAGALRERAAAFADVVKVGRTHLQDGVPISLGQEFGAYAAAVSRGAARIEAAAQELLAVNIGGTAVGTGLNAPPGYAAQVVERLAAWTGRPLRLAGDLVDATQNVDALVTVSAALRTAAVSLSKIASDLRLLASGPLAGLGELRLPPVQPGSSIMPGKVNPVMAELINQVAFQVQGNDLVVSLAAQHGQLELNVMQPVLMHNLLVAAQITANAVHVFTERCVRGIEPHYENIQRHLDRSITTVTALNPYIGYDAAARVAKESLATGKPVREIVLAQGLLPPDVVDAVLSPENLTRGSLPVPIGAAAGGGHRSNGSGHRASGAGRPAAGPSATPRE
ncbi:MAG: aspartate ammonia-lyase [Limnochordales bacterium]|nr:aspartate ammonia-lyase [Limnochordales bacterium]